MATDLPVKTLRVQSKESQLDNRMGEEENSNCVSSQLVDLIGVLRHVDAHTRKVDDDQDRVRARVDLAEEI